MSIVLTGRPDSRLDHFSEAGDRTSHSYLITAVGHDGAALCGLRIVVRVSGAFSTEFLVLPGRVLDADRDLQTQLILLDNARDAINANRFERARLKVPGKDVSIPGLSVLSIEVEGPLDERIYTMTLIDNVKAKLRENHGVLKLTKPSAVITSTKL